MLLTHFLCTASPAWCHFQDCVFPRTKTFYWFLQSFRWSLVSAFTLPLILPWFDLAFGFKCFYLAIGSQCFHLVPNFDVCLSYLQVTYIQKAHQAKHLDVLVACLGPAAIPIEGYETPARESTLHVTSRAVMRHLLGVEKCLEMGVLDREEEGNSHELFGFVLLRHETGVFRKPREMERVELAWILLRPLSNLALSCCATRRGSLLIESSDSMEPLKLCLQ